MQQNSTILDNKERIERLKELRNIAILNHLANSKKEFADLIGKSPQTVRNALQNGTGVVKLVALTESVLEAHGIRVTYKVDLDRRIEDLERRVAILESKHVD